MFLIVSAEQFNSLSVAPPVGRLGVWLPSQHKPQQEGDQLHHECHERVGREASPGRAQLHLSQPQQLPELQQVRGDGGENRRGVWDVAAADLQVSSESPVDVFVKALSAVLSPAGGLHVLCSGWLMPGHQRMLEALEGITNWARVNSHFRTILTGEARRTSRWRRLFLNVHGEPHPLCVPSSPTCRGSTLFVRHAIVSRWWSNCNSVTSLPAQFSISPVQLHPHLNVDPKMMYHSVMLLRIKINCVIVSHQILTKKSVSVVLI